MTAINPNLDDLSLDRGDDPWDTLLPLLLGAVAMTIVAGFGLWFLSSSSPSPSPTRAPLVAVAHAPAVAPLAPTRAAADLFGAIPDFPQPLTPPARRATAELDAKPYGELVDLFAKPEPNSGSEPQPAPAAPPPAGLDATRSALADAPLPPKRDVARIDDDVPLPPVRPVEFAALEAPAAADSSATPKPLGPSRSLEPTLAYAAPDTPAVATPASPGNASIFSLFGGRPQRPAGYDEYTAVYDISAKVLYMPDGTTIEAHSGLGDSMDDPNRVGEHAKGPTPPDLYDLQMRESLFHGVAAIRLLPVGGDAAVYGREGLLAHPFMMGDNGDSNGCVSIKDYDAFLKAYQDGKIKRLAVVAKL